MTTIKLNQDLEIKGCSTCPFAQSEEEQDYGEWNGHFTCYCGLLHFNAYKEIQIIDENGYESHRSDKPDICPIIEIKSE